LPTRNIMSVCRSTARDQWSAKDHSGDWREKRTKINPVMTASKKHAVMISTV